MPLPDRPRVFVAQTDWAWFRFLREQADARGRVDEVNFWSPLASKPLSASLRPGDPVFLRLKSPRDAIAGYGFYGAFSRLHLEQAWEWFGWRNGAPDAVRFLRRIGAYRGQDLLDPKTPRDPLGCTILRNVFFWPEDRWLPWTGEEAGWHPNIVRGRMEREPANVERLLVEVQHDALPEEFQEFPEEEVFLPLDADERIWELSLKAKREGQGTFRTRLLEAYRHQCAITGEHTEPVLDAAHIQPYLGPRSNHPKNGLLLTKELHTLFDLGYVTVTPEYEVRVSPRLRAEWDNGHRYYPHDGQRLVVLPGEAERPSPQVLAWHNEKVFRG